MAKWHEFRNRHIPCVLPLLYYWSWPISHVTGAEAGVRVNVWENGDYRVYWTEQGYSLTEQYAFNYLRKNARNLGQVRKAGIAAGKKVVRHCKSFASKSANASLNEFLTFLKKLELLHNEFTKKSMLIWLTAGDILEAKIREGLEGKPGAENIFRIMLKPKSKSYSQIEEEEFEKVVLLAQQEGIDGKRTKGSITKFSKKYFWFPFEYVGPEVWDEQAVRRRVQEVLKAGITKTEIGRAHV